MPITLKLLTQKQQAQIDNSFVYHAPFGDQPERYGLLRSKAKELAELICQLTPESREQSLALTQLQLANMLANAAIACNEVKPVA